MLPARLSDSLGKLPPQDLALEEAILGALIIEKHALPDVVAFLRSEHFYSESHQLIYEACVALYSSGDPVDMRTVASYLRKKEKLELVGGAYHIAELTSKVSSAANIEYHARIIVQLHLKRQVIVISSEMNSKAYDDSTDAFELLDFSAQKIQNIDDDVSREINEKSVKEIAFESIKKIQSRVAGQSVGIASGFQSVDSILNGFHPGHLIILGGRPGMAKSTIAFQWLYHISHDFGIPVAAFSLEMPRHQPVDRLACAISEIDSDRVKSNSLNNYEFERLSAAYGEISNAPFRIDDSPALHIADLRARSKRLVQKHGVRIILVDYIQMMRGSMFGERITRDQEIGNISRGLKTIAKENNATVIAISSLSRGVELRGGDKRPQLQDLRDSSNLESDADAVCFAYRPEIYNITTDEFGNPTHGLFELIVAKHRDGSLGTAKLKFIGKHTKFKEWNTEFRSFSPLNQTEYIARHVKDVLPSERTPEDFDRIQDPPF